MLYVYTMKGGDKILEFIWKKLTVFYISYGLYEGRRMYVCVYNYSLCEIIQLDERESLLYTILYATIWLFGLLSMTKV